MTTAFATFLKEINEAYARNDPDFIIDQVADDVTWTLVGDQVIHGKQAFAEAARGMARVTPSSLHIQNIITHGVTGVVNGTLKMTDESGRTISYAFCDVYRMSRFKGGKIRELTSYVIPLKH